MLLWIACLGLVFNVIVNLILIPIYGKEGAAAATVMTEAVVLLPALYILSRYIGSAPSFWVTGRLLPVAGVAGVMVYALHLPWETEFVLVGRAVRRWRRGDAHHQAERRAGHPKPPPTGRVDAGLGAGGSGGAPMSDRLRIAVYYNAGWGGGRRWLYECMSRLSRYHDLDLFSIDSTGGAPHYPDVSEFAEHSRAVPFRTLQRTEGRLKLLNPASMWVDVVRFDRASMALAAEIDAGGYDLLFASVGGYTEAPLILRHARTPSAYYCHEPMRNLYEPQEPRPYKRRLKQRIRAASPALFYGTLVKRWDRQGTLRSGAVIANSRYCAGYAERAYGVHAEVNYPGVDAEAFAPGGEPRERIVLTVGEILPTKGFDWAVRAIGAIPAAMRPPLVLVCNRTNPNERAYIEDVARECGVDLQIRERVPDAELKRLFRVASAFLYTPHREPFGLAAIEAMASGTPVVAVREAGPAETIVDGETGFLRERDPQQLGDAMSRLLDDAELRERMGRSAREHAVQRWTWDRSVEHLQGLLTDAAARLRTSRDGSRAQDRLETADMTVARRET